MGGNKVIDNYVLLKVIGSGQFGDVYKAKRLDNEEFFAVKTIKIDKFQNTPQLHTLTKNEVEILSKIDNPNIIKFIKMLKTTNNIYIVYELCNGGTLEELLDKKKYLKEIECIEIMKQLLNACKTLVQMNILHRDIKPSNILFQDSVIKVADFGFCKSLSTSSDYTETMVGSPVYMAPEILKGQPYNLKADIYSLGVVLYEMVYGIVPFEDSTIPGLLTKIKDGKITFHNFNKISSTLETLIKKMLDPIPNSRLDWPELFDYFSEEKLAEAGGAKITKENIPIIDTKPISIIPTLDLKFYINNPLNTQDQNQIKEQPDSIMPIYMLRCKVLRDKLLFLWRVFALGLELIIGEETHYIQYLILKRMHNLNHEVLGLFQNKANQFTKDEFKYLKEQVDYGKVFTLMNNETMKFDEIFSSYRNFLITSLDKKKLPKDIDSELVNLDHNEENFKIRVISYINKIKSKLEVEASLDKGEIKRFALHQNFLLDTIILNEVFENFMAPSLNLNNQPYLTKLSSFEPFELFELANRKLTYIKGKND